MDELIGEFHNPPVLRIHKYSANKNRNYIASYMLKTVLLI